MLPKFMPSRKNVLQSIAFFALGYIVATHYARTRENQFLRQFYLVNKSLSAEGFSNEVTLLDSDNFYLPMLNMLNDPEVAKQRFLNNKQYYQKRVAQAQEKYPNTPVCFAWGSNHISLDHIPAIYEGYAETSYALVYDPRFIHRASASEIISQWKNEKNYVYREEDQQNLRNICPFKHDLGTTELYRKGYDYFQALGDGYYIVSGSAGAMPQENLLPQP
jgi:hypothetical protein